LDTSVERELTADWTVNAVFRDDTEIGIAADGDASDDRFNTSPTSSYTFSGLKDGERYNVDLNCAVHQPRNGSRSTEFDSGHIDADATTILPAPTDLSADAVAADSVDLSWAATHNYGDTLVQHRRAGVTSSWTTFATLARTTETDTVTGLLNGEEYDLRVVANTEHTQSEDI